MPDYQSFYLDVTVVESRRYHVWARSASEAEEQLSEARVSERNLISSDEESFQVTRIEEG